MHWSNWKALHDEQQHKVLNAFFSFKSNQDLKKNHSSRAHPPLAETSKDIRCEGDLMRRHGKLVLPEFKALRLCRGLTSGPAAAGDPAKPPEELQ